MVGNLKSGILFLTSSYREASRAGGSQDKIPAIVADK
jgi:hypothetical protein